MCIYTIFRLPPNIYEAQSAEKYCYYISIFFDDDVQKFKHQTTGTDTSYFPMSQNNRHLLNCE